MTGLKVPDGRFSITCGVCGTVVYGTDATDLMMKFRAHLLAHGPGGTSPHHPRPPEDRFK